MTHASNPIVLTSLLAAALAGGEAAPAPVWENLSAGFFADVAQKPSGNVGIYGLCLDPKNSSVLLDYGPYNSKLAVKGLGLYRSADRGDTWALSEIPLSGRGETGFWSNTPQPYNGRMALWTIDGVSVVTGDGGVTWRKLGKSGRGFDYADADWNAGDPQTMFGLEHEPFFRVLSIDGGATWKRIDEAADTESFKQNKKWYPRVGVAGTKALVATDGLGEGVLYSGDLGSTWIKVADFKPLGLHPIHYGKRLYWAASAGVIVSEDGKTWKLLGSELANANWGPYFGTTEKDLLVVTDKGLHLSRDAAVTWNLVAPPPPKVWLGNPRTLGVCFAWDAANRIVYASSPGGCYRLLLEK